jgi:hypothetical protein
VWGQIMMITRRTLLMEKNKRCFIVSRVIAYNPKNILTIDKLSSFLKDSLKKEALHEKEFFLIIQLYLQKLKRADAHFT